VFYAKKYLFHDKFKFEKKSFDGLNLKLKEKFLRAQMKCRQIQDNSERSLDDIFTERVYEWEVPAFLKLRPDDLDLLGKPVDMLKSFNHKIFLKRLTLHDPNMPRPGVDSFDINPVTWYFVLNLLARSNASGVTSKGSMAEVDHRFKINIYGMVTYI